MNDIHHQGILPSIFTMLSSHHQAPNSWLIASAGLLFVSLSVYTYLRRSSKKSLENAASTRAPSEKTPRPTAPDDLSALYPPSRREFMKDGAKPFLPHAEVTATGFSKADIEALGDFPDYETLSGFRLPHAYPEFDIKRAKARPYRPVRWVYHQTMCK